MRPISDESFNILVGVMERFFPLSVRFKISLRLILCETTYRKGVRILNRKVKQEFAWFLLDGLSREIRVDRESFEERTVWFWKAFHFIITPGFFSREESESTIEITDDCKVILISYDNWAKLKDDHQETESLTEKIRHLLELLKQELADDIRDLKADTRYLKRKDEIEELLKVTKLRYVAEYIGMSTDMLSKLRKKY